MAGALDGVRVLDLSRVLADPYATMILGDLGADVIKIEAPGGSDDTRFWGPPFQNGMSAYYTAVNRNKRSVTVDLKTEQGRETVRRLAETADVVIHNFKTGTMDKWGLENTLRQAPPTARQCRRAVNGRAAAGRHNRARVQ